MIPADLQARLDTGATTLCRCWRMVRKDGRVLGFTDHDGALTFEGTTFRATDGLSAAALEQTTGLSVDNAGAAGILSDAGITEADIAAGRYDGAGVEAWLVDWSDVSLRTLLFRGTLGEIERTGCAFRAELRGLAEALNRPQGRVYQAPCDAILGDAACGVDLSDPAYAYEARIVEVAEGRRLILPVPSRFAEGWFLRGTLRVLSGPAAGLLGMIRRDAEGARGREIELWQSIRAELAPGDRVRIAAGCDKRVETCRAKFGNVVNFRGFPHIPSEDWLMAYPVQGGGS